MITLHVCDKNRGILMPPNAHPANVLDKSMVWLGRTISWCVPTMAFLVLLIVVLRYGFNTGAIAAQETVQYLHAAIFMLGARWHCRLTNTFALISSSALLGAAASVGQRAGSCCLHPAIVRLDWRGFLGLRDRQLDCQRSLSGAWRAAPRLPIESADPRDGGVTRASPWRRSRAR